MMPDKRVIDNIKKLISLGMSEDDIISQLENMGVNESDAKELIANAKGKEDKSKEEKEEKPKTEEKEELLPKNLFKDDDIEDIKSLDENNIEDTQEEKEKPKSEEEKEDYDLSSGLNVDDFKKYTDDDSDDTKETNDYDINIDLNKEKSNSSKNENIWQSGLVTTLNTKIAEIEEKQKEIEENIQKKMDVEINKYKKIQQTTKNLLLSNVKEELANAKENIVGSVTKQLTQIKIEQAKINKSVSEIDSGKKEVSEKIQEFDNVKDKVTEDAERIQDEIKKMASTITVKINQKTKQINEILSLQSKISQGLIKNTKTAVEKEVQKIAEFKEKVDSQINPKKLYDKLEELEKFKTQLAKRYDNRFDAVKDEFLKKAHNAFKEKINEELKDVQKVKEEIVQKTDPEIINKKLEELEIFEKHLLSKIDEKITQSLNIYESGITQEFKGKIKEFDEQIKKTEDLFNRLELAKENIKEINGFKDQFITIVDKNIEKMNKTMSTIEEKLKKIEEK